jgi:hypothetical protein
VRVSVEHRPVLDAAVAPGGFRLVAPLAGPPGRGPLLVGVSTDSPFIPKQAGMGDDERVLGIFLSTACTE